MFSGGFDVMVAGVTTLTGGAIASVAEAAFGNPKPLKGR